MPNDKPKLEEAEPTGTLSTKVQVQTGIKKAVKNEKAVV